VGFVKGQNHNTNKGKKLRRPLIENQVEALAKADPQSLEPINDHDLNHEAWLRIVKDPRYQPLASLIPEPKAAQIEPWLDQYVEFHPKTRVAICKYVRYSLFEDNWAKAKQTAAIELGFDVRVIDYWKHRWPEMFLVINAILRHDSEMDVGRVIKAATHAAIYGDSRDRRLYLELFGHIKREAGAGEDNKTIILINDVVDRPAATSIKTIEAEKVESEVLDL